MRCLDSKTFDQFKDLKLVVNSNKSSIIYNMKRDFYLSIKDLKIDNISFDLCIQDDKNYMPVIKGLKYESNNTNDEFLLFSFYVNGAKKYLKFTTKTMFNDLDYEIYPEVNYDNGVYNTSADDVKFPYLFESYANSGIISASYDNLDIVESFQINSKFCKRVYENEIIIIKSTSYVVLNESSYNTYYNSVPNSDLALSIFKIEGMLYLCSNSYDTAKEYGLDKLLIDADHNPTVNSFFRSMSVTFENDILYITNLNKQQLTIGENKRFVVVI